jgi:hypothetical protein
VTHDLPKLVMGWVTSGLHGLYLSGSLLAVHIAGRLARKVFQTAVLTELGISTKEVTMTVAFQLSDLLADIKAQGLPMAEKDLEMITKATLDWASKSCVLKGGAFLVGPALIPVIQAQIIALEDKIDGQANS